ncbi:MAG TPA: methyl-accepting chemotaxis protein [Bacillota bacterium]|nr:methyl-accepting chemotaxis protein [Bacillota bacterium]
MKWFYHIPIARKLLIVFTAVCLFIAVTGYLGVVALQKVNSDINTMYNQRFLPVIDLLKVNKAISENSLILMNAAQMAATDTQVNEEVSQNIRIADDILKAYGEQNLSPEEADIFKTLQIIMTAYKSNLAGCIELVKAKNQTALVPKINGANSQKKAIEDGILKLVDIQTKKSKELYETSDSKYAFSRNLTIGLVTISILLAIFYGNLLTRMIARPINEVKNKLEEISKAGGDLTQRLTVHSRDEVGQLAEQFNSMMDSIQRIIQQVLTLSQFVADVSSELTQRAQKTSHASEEISQVMKQIATGANEQVQSLTETSISMNQMSSGVQQISANSMEVTNASSHATDIAREGREIIDLSMEKIEKVTTMVTGSADMMKHLGERSQAIGKIVNVITGIANQTNLLALNAAIEAARASEHGRGFAVVADEVRKLAEESGKAAQQIALMIKEIQEETAKVSDYMVTGTSEVQDGLSAAKEAKNSFVQIHDAIETVNKQITEVSAATEQMAAGTDDVLQSVQTIVQIAETATEETSKAYTVADDSLALMQEILASSQAMSEVATDLQKLVGQFKV